VNQRFLGPLINFEDSMLSYIAGEQFSLQKVLDSLDFNNDSNGDRYAAALCLRRAFLLTTGHPRTLSFLYQSVALRPLIWIASAPNKFSSQHVKTAIEQFESELWSQLNSDSSSPGNSCLSSFMDMRCYLTVPTSSDHIFAPDDDPEQKRTLENAVERGHLNSINAMWLDPSSSSRKTMLDTKAVTSAEHLCVSPALFSPPSELAPEYLKRRRVDHWYLVPVPQAVNAALSVQSDGRLSPLPPTGSGSRDTAFYLWCTTGLFPFGDLSRYVSLWSSLEPNSPSSVVHSQSVGNKLETALATSLFLRHVLFSRDPYLPNRCASGKVPLEDVLGSADAVQHIAQYLHIVDSAFERDAARFYVELTHIAVAPTQITPDNHARLATESWFRSAITVNAVAAEGADVFLPVIAYIGDKEALRFYIAFQCKNKKKRVYGSKVSNFVNVIVQYNQNKNRNDPIMVPAAVSPIMLPEKHPSPPQSPREYLQQNTKWLLNIPKESPKRRNPVQGPWLQTNARGLLPEYFFMWFNVTSPP
jgi:hypothetical protein